MSKSYALSRTVELSAHETETRYMDKDGYFVIHDIWNAQKFPQECEWLIDHIVDRWNSEHQHGIQAFYQRVLVKEDEDVGDI